MLRDDFRPPLLIKNEFFDTRGRYLQNILKTVIEPIAPLHFTSLKKKLSDLDFWNSSYDHFSDSISKLPLVAKM